MDKKPKRVRADELLFEKGLCESRNQAKTLIMAGQVRLGTETINKASRLLCTSSEISILTPMKYVGRGGLKMENFLKDSGIQVQGLRILDLGASTGGFTDCLLQLGASHATCIDVGHGQLHYRLRTDERVINLEKTNVRGLSRDDIQNSPFPLVVMDLSFISLRKVLPQAWCFLERGGKLISLVKPQFECSKKEADLGKGVIREEGVQNRVLQEIKDFAKAQLKGCELFFEATARPRGTEGNQEFFLDWSKKI